MKSLRVVLAFLVAPVVAGTISVTSSLVFWPQGNPRFAEFLEFVFFLALLGLAAEVVVGIPLLLLGYRIGYIRFPLFLAGGVVAALAIGGFNLITDIGASLAWFLAMVLFPAVVASFVLWVAGGWSSNHSFNRTRPLRRATGTPVGRAG